MNVQKVLWGLDELGLSYDHRIVGGKYGGLDQPEFSELTPIPRVPVLQDGELAIWESHAILRHLARNTGQLGIPETVVDMWMEFGSTTLQPPFIGVFWQKVRLLPEDQDPDAAASQLTKIESALKMLNTGLADGRGHLAGDAFSIADIAVGSIFYRLLSLFPNILNSTPFVAAWQARIQDRPSYTRWIETSYEELRVTA